MSLTAQWLARLSSATGYDELQDVFAAMAADARTTDEPEALAGSIDEAIERLRRERARDEDELKAYEAEYAEFKEEQSGVVGWFRRRLPFTETRRQEKEHKAEVADQEAEVLADNFVIARAQMLKENLLPPQRRRLGLDPAEWERRLAAQDAVERLKAYGEALGALGRDLPTGRAFVAQLDAEIDAFAGAKFSAEADRRRKKADLAGARQELAALSGELKRKEDLRSEGVKRLRELVTSDLEANDAGYQALARRVTGLEGAVAQAEAVARSLADLQEAIGKLKGTAELLATVEGKRRELAREEGRLRAQSEAAERERLEAAGYVAEHATRADASKNVLRRAQEALAAAQCAHEAHVASTGQVELPEGAAFETSSPAAAGLARAQQALEEAQASHRTASAPYEAARTEAEKAERAAREAAEKLARLAREEEALAKEERRLRSDLEAGQGAVRPHLRETPDLVGTYVRTLESLDRRSGFQESRDRFVSRTRFELAGEEPVPEEPSALQAAAERLEALRKTAAGDQDALDEDLRRERLRVEAAFTQRCHDVLGGDLTGELF